MTIDDCRIRLASRCAGSTPGRGAWYTALWRPIYAAATAVTLPVLTSCVGFERPFQEAFEPHIADPYLTQVFADRLDDLLPHMGTDSIIEHEELRRKVERTVFAIGHPDVEQYRAKGCRVILDRMRPETPRLARAWLLRQLERIGGTESVDALAQLLVDDDPLIRESARRALQANSSPKAASVIRNALRRANDPGWQVALINALAARGGPADASVIAPFAAAAEDDVSAAAIVALGDLGGPLATPVLYDLWRSDDEYVQNLASAALIRIADRMVGQERNKGAAAIYLDLYQSSVAHVHRLAALRGLAAADGEAVLPLLLGAMRGHVDPNMGTIAVRLMLAIPGEAVTRALVDAISGAVPEVRAVLLGALAERGGPATRTAAIDAINDEAEAVRIAALGALQSLGTRADVVLLASAAAARTGDERRTARTSLYRLRGDEVDAEILTVARTLAEATARSELFRALAERRYLPAMPTLFETASDEDESVRVAALEAMGKLAGPDDVAAVVALLVNEEGDDARQAAEDAVVSICLNFKLTETFVAEPSARGGSGSGTEQAIGPILAALTETNGETKASLISILGRVRGDLALKVIRAAVEDDIPEVADAAIRAMTNWDKAVFLDDLARIVSTTTDSKRRVLALRGYVRQIRLPSDRTPNETLALLTEMMQSVERSDQQKLILSAVGDVITLEALQVAERHLETADLCDEAAAAILNIARTLSATRRVTSLAAVERVLAARVTDGVLQQARDALEYIESHAGYIVTWQVAGPYTKDGIKADDLLDTVFAPESDDADHIEWQPLTIIDPKHPWSFDLEQAIGGSTRCAYVRAQVWSDHPTAAVLRIGSDDGVKVWLNDQVAHTNNVFRGLTMDEDTIHVELKEGWNRLMLKISQGSGGWKFSCRIAKPDGQPLEGVRFSAE